MMSARVPWAFCVALLLAATAGCGHRGAMHVLPQARSAANGSAHHRKPATINEAAYPNAVLHDSPIAFYRLDDTGSTLADYGANGLNGTYGSSVTHGAGSLVPNTIDPAAAFPGGAWSANSIATVPHTTSLQPSSLSIEAWVSEQVANSGGYIDLVSYGPQSGGQAYSLQISPSNTLSAFVVTTNSPNYSQFSGTTVLTPGTPYHIVMTYDGTSPKIYINGVADSGTVSGATTGGNIGYSGVGTTYGLSFGGGQSTSRNVLNGTIDDVSIYSSALTSTQVAAHDAAAQAAPDDVYADTVMTDTPLAYYRLDDTGGTTMYDATNDRLNGAYGSGITRGATGLIANSPDAAASFPGGSWSASSIATVPQSGTLQPSSAVSVEAWAKESATNTTGNAIDLVSYGPVSGAAYSLKITASNTFAFTVRTTAPATLTVTGTTTLSAGTVYHAVGTYDGTTSKLYVNGSLEASSPGSGGLSYSGISTYGLSIGAGQSTIRSVFNGVLDEVAVYGTALSDTRIAAHDNVSAFTPSGTGPSHIQSWAYYDNSNNVGVSLSYLLRYIDWAEETAPVGNFGGSYLPLLNGFKAAGGAHAVWYGDPGLSHYCNAPFDPAGSPAPGSCYAAISGYTSESDFLHGYATPNYCQGGGTPCPGYTPSPAGSRLHTQNPDYDSTHGWVYIEKLNPAATQGRSLYTSYTNSQLGLVPLLDAVEMDDSSPYYRIEEFNSQFGTTATEYGTSSGNTTYTSDVVGLACASKRPVFFNGASYDPNASMATSAADGAMYSSPCVLGAMIEGAFTNSDGYRKSLSYGASWNTFLAAADKALLAQSYRKYALVENEVSIPYGSSGYDPVGDRTYGLGGIWLVYDPRYTIAWSHFTYPFDHLMIDGDGNPDSMAAELQIVPTQPLTTATGNDIATLQRSGGNTKTGAPPGGVFVREFTTCYQNGTSIGHCAVVLNAEDNTYTNGGVVSVPSLTYTYTSSLVITDAPADNGGTATWTGSVPTTLQPTTAVLLKQ